jgi:hypothetical protein
VAVDDAGHLALPETMVSDGSDVIRRAYATAVVRVRLHQRAFRERILEAYSRQGSFCRLRHEELLDAAHIISDAEAAGDPHVTNEFPRFSVASARAVCDLTSSVRFTERAGERPRFLPPVGAPVAFNARRNGVRYG